MDSFAIPPNSDGNDRKDDLSSNLFLSNLLNTLPRWDSMPSNKNSQNDNSKTESNLFSNILDPYNTNRTNNLISSTIHHFNNNNHNLTAHENAIDIFGAIGTVNQRARHLSPSTSPQTNSSSNSSSHSVFCGRCDVGATSRCLDCNDVFCTECVNEHIKNAFTEHHSIVGIGKITPIGSATSASMFSDFHIQSMNEPQCETHGEVLRFLCETCKTVVCQECTMKEHKDHQQIAIASITIDSAKEKLKAVYESSKLGIKFIKTSIDRAVTYSQSIERDSMEISSRIKKALRLLILAAEDRERALLEQVDKYRQQKIANLSDQMTGLRSALAGLAETSENLTKTIDTIDNVPQIEIASILANTENQIEKFAAMYKNLQPKEEFISFVPPNFELLQDIRNQGEIVINSRNSPSQNGGSNGSGVAQSSTLNAVAARRPIVRNIPPVSTNGRQLSWDSNPAATSAIASTTTSSYVVSSKSYASMVKPPSQIIGQCIPGSIVHVSAKPALGPSLTFCFDGHDDGEVSRPWGVCVNKDNEIVIADRRNNRIQVFFADGTFKFKFGSKGTGNGQFDLPAGVCTDLNNRIIVVDKDNHRIQIFSGNGTFINKFGSYGKELSQFMYPWAVAVNTKSQILVTDSRNHRIQLFSPDGHFISRFSFDGVNHSRYLKGLTTPRGVTFNPQGDIIISDFENHRLILIDSTMTKILATKGHEGSALHEFCRPSGICCDDDGRVIVADSKNQRVLIFSPMLEFLWAVEIRPSSHNILTANMDEKDRPSDVSLLNDGRLVVLVETSPDSREAVSPHKTFVQVY